MGEAFRLNEDARRQIDKHLDSIDEVLRSAEMSRSERQNILDDVETQIVEMLTARTGANPTVEDVKAVIAELDPPESYASEGQREQRKEPDRSAPLAPAKKWTLDKIAFVFSIGGLVLPVLLIVAGEVWPRWAVRPGAELDMWVRVVPALLVFVAFELTGLVLGGITWRRSCGKAAAILSASSLILSLFFTLFFVGVAPA